MVRYAASTALLLVSFSVFAQTSDVGPAGGRVMNAHLFLPSRLVDDPFITTYLGESTGFGYATISANHVDSQGNVGGKTPYQLGALGQGFNLQVGILDSWAIRLAAAGTVLSGIDAESALTIGATIGYALSTGATYSLLVGGCALRARSISNIRPNTCEPGEGTAEYAQYRSHQHAFHQSRHH